MKTSCELSHAILLFMDCKIKLETKDKPEPLFYSITEVSEIVGVPPHVIRYWEKHFNNLKPGRGSSSNWRNYVVADIESLTQIKKLVNDKGLTISGAKKILARPKSSFNLIEALEEVLSVCESS